MGDVINLAQYRQRKETPESKMRRTMQNMATWVQPDSAQRYSNHYCRVEGRLSRMPTGSTCRRCGEVIGRGRGC